MDSKLVQKMTAFLIRSESQKDRSKSDYFVFNDVVTKANSWNPAPYLGPLDQDVFVVFVDDHPDRGWDHDCRYLLFDGTANNPKLLEVRQATRPPFAGTVGFGDAFMRLSVRRPASRRLQPLAAPANAAAVCEFETVTTIVVPPTPPHPLLLPINPAKAHALLFSGMSDPHNINNMELTFRVLTTSLGFDPRNIRICNFNGEREARTPLVPPTNCSVGHYTFNPARQKGSRLQLIHEIEELSRIPETTGEDQDVLFLQIDGHGSADAQHSFFRCYDGSVLGEKFHQQEFGILLDGVSRFKLIIVVMHQCSAGGFSIICQNGTSEQARVFLSASGPLKSHQPLCGTFTLFTRDWYQKLLDKAQQAGTWQQLIHDAFLQVGNMNNNAAAQYVAC